MTVGRILAATAAELQRERLRLVLLTLGTPLVFVLLLLLARWRDRIPDVPDLLTEPPEDLHPVDLAFLWSAYRNHLSPRSAFRAEIIHLARIGAIRLEPIGTVSDPSDFRITLENRPDKQVDRDFVQFMFPAHSAGAQTVTISQLRKQQGGESVCSDSGAMPSNQ